MVAKEAVLAVPVIDPLKLAAVTIPEALIFEIDKPVEVIFDDPT